MTKHPDSRGALHRACSVNTWQESDHFLPVPPTVQHTGRGMEESPLQSFLVEWIRSPGIRRLEWWSLSVCLSLVFSLTRGTQPSHWQESQATQRGHTYSFQKIVLAKMFVNSQHQPPDQGAFRQPAPSLWVFQLRPQTLRTEAGHAHYPLSQLLTHRTREHNKWLCYGNRLHSHTEWNILFAPHPSLLAI